jgi:hypothetical protein
MRDKQGKKKKKTVKKFTNLRWLKKSKEEK